MRLNESPKNLVADDLLAVFATSAVHSWSLPSPLRLVWPLPSPLPTLTAATIGKTPSRVSFLVRASKVALRASSV